MWKGRHFFKANNSIRTTSGNIEMNPGQMLTTGDGKAEILLRQEFFCALTTTAQSK